MKDVKMIHKREWLLRTRRFPLSDLFVISGGRHYVSPAYFLTHRPGSDACALVYVLAGEGSIRYGHQEHHAGADSIFALISGVGFSYGTNPQNLWKFLWVGFRGTQACSLLSRVGLTPAHPVLTGDAICQLRSHFVELHQLGANREPGSFCSVLGKLWMILGELMNQHSTRSQRHTVENPASFDLASRVAKHLTEHLAHPITLQQLSRIFFASPYHLVRIFREEMGQSPIDFLIDERIRAAQHLLLDGSKSIAEVARLVSYQDAAYFSRLFKQRTGLSPIQHRNRHR